jgi:hypothetical protein
MRIHSCRRNRRYVKSQAALHRSLTVDAAID